MDPGTGRASTRAVRGHAGGAALRRAPAGGAAARRARAASGGNGTLSAAVHQQLAALLVSGVVSPGETLSLRRVAEQFGVSIQPVREAVSRLVADSALEVTPKRAVRIPLMSLAQFRELTTIRIAIEGFAAEQAARGRREADLPAMRRFDAAFRRQCQSRTPDVTAAVAANQAFHFAVYRAAGLPSLVAIIEGLWLRIGPVLNLDMRSNSVRLRMGRAERCHARMLAAIERRRPAAARAALIADISGAAAYIESRGVLPDGEG